MEGATGVVHPDQLVPDGRNYTQAQSLLTRDVNAVITGILTVEPAAYICVGDGHATMRNILLEDLHPNAELVCGPATIQNKPLCQLEGISSKFDIAMCIGYHTKAGTPGGLLAHTFVGSLISDLRMNGVSVGEVEVNSAVMSSYGVPLCLIYGNSDLEAEIRAWNDASVFLASKTVLGPTAAICKPPAITQRLLEHGAARATADSQTWFRYACGSVRFEVDTK